jgi:hypothetical protein
MGGQGLPSEAASIQPPKHPCGSDSLRKEKDQAVTEPTIICPNCKTEIWLTESLAAPLIAATRKQLGRQLSQKDEAVAKREQGIVAAFSTMQEDLDKERKAIMKQWAKREEQIERVMGATVGMYGDLQGIAGKSLQEIEGLELVALGVSNSVEG